ncbi:MAG: MFS transporter [Acidiferrobacterales bacterium]
MAVSNQFSLLKERRFGPFFSTQFLGAFNDNVFKQALVTLIAFYSAHLISTSTDTLINLSAGLFILPFFLFSATAGQLADKYEKSRLIRWVKLLEIVIMLCAAVGFYLQNVPLLIGLLFLMGTQSTLFGPVKYGLLPQVLKDEELVGGNALVETGTFLAILLGTIGGTQLIGMGEIGIGVTAATVVVVAALGYLVSWRIPSIASADPELRINWNPITETWRILRFAYSSRTVFLSILGISWFWFVGAMYVAQLPNYTRLTIGGNENVLTVLITLFTIGIGAGSLLCERLAGHKVEIGLVPFGSIGLTVFGIDLFFASPPVSAPVDTALIGALGFLQSPGNWRVTVDIVLIGMFGGFYIVPLYALVQQRSEPAHLSRVIAANNIVNALFMVVAAAYAIVLLRAGLTIPQLFLVAAIMNAAVAFYIYTLVPEFLMRFIVWLLIHSIYRVQKNGLEQIPDRGAAVLVCNHVSFVDALVIAGCVRRPIRFVMYYKIFNLPILKFVFRTARAIPIAPATENKTLLARAYDEIAAALDRGDLVCVFPEGHITEDGEIHSFRPGIERLVKRNPVPVIPMALRGLWGTFFSRKGGRAMRRFPTHLWAKIALAVGAPVAPETATANALQQSVLALRGDRR